MTQVLDHIVNSSQLDVTSIRAEFPILERLVHGNKKLVYFDNAATTQKPAVVLDEVNRYYGSSNANVHRAGHTLANEATRLYEGSRQCVARFIGAAEGEVIFTRGTTESLNLIASTLGRHLGASLRNKRVVLTEMEHHSNIVPWQILCETYGATIAVIPVDDAGNLDLIVAKELIDDQVAIVSVVHTSNVLGVTNNVAYLCELARSVGAYSVVDGAQSVVHHKIDVAALGCDFFAFSGHKLFAPTGIGILFGRADVLSNLPPYQGGGSMISTVSFDGSTFLESPHRFEAGTPNIAGAVGLKAAIEWVEQLPKQALENHRATIGEELLNELHRVEGLQIVGTPDTATGIFSFVVDGLHSADISVLLDEQGVAVRAGHHCAMPLMKRFGLDSTVRASLALYNTSEEVAVFSKALSTAIRILRTA